MVRYQVILAYDGSAFQGFQRQANARTVQGVVETALRQLGWKGRSILAAGRTDTGVHASGQVIAFDLEWAHSADDLQGALNACLPFDVAAVQVQAVASDFHPRRDARWRRYRYNIYCRPVRDPLQERFAWRVWPPADLSLLEQAASLLPGRHDFAAFGTPPQPGGSTIRTVRQASWSEATPLLTFEIVAHAFLYHMVRRLVYMQVLIGQGKLELDTLRQALRPSAQRPGLQNPLLHGLAPAQGLILAEIEYPTSIVAQADNQEIFT